MILPNFGCGTRVTVRTTMVLFMVLEITSPVLVLREARVTGPGSEEAGDETVCSCSAIILFLRGALFVAL